MLITTYPYSNILTPLY